MSSITIIGGGAAGYTAALACAERQAKVTLFEKQEIGGVCLHKGCIPTKTMLYYIQLFEKTIRACENGIFHGRLSVSLQGLQQYTKEKMQELRYAMVYRLKKAGVEIQKAEAVVLKDGTIQASYADGSIRIFSKPDYILHAEGARWQLNDLMEEKENLLFPEDLLTIESLPANAIVVGGGVTGVETAMILAGLQVPVTILESRGEILSGFEQEAVSYLKQNLQEQNIKICCNTPWTPSFAGKETMVFWCGGKIQQSVSNREEKESNNEYYIGDVREDCSLASVAKYQGIKCAGHIFGEKEYHLRCIPQVIYGKNAVAQVGTVTGNEIKQGFYYQNGLAHIQESDTGFVKFYFDKNTKIIKGIVIAGESAPELIGEAAVLVQNQMTIRQLKETIHPHPSLCELLAECVETV